MSKGDKHRQSRRTGLGYRAMMLSIANCGRGLALMAATDCSRYLNCIRNQVSALPTPPLHSCAAQVAREKGRMPQDGYTQRVVPLFETLADLRSAGASLRRLLSVPWYRRQLQCVPTAIRPRHVTSDASHMMMEAALKLCHGGH